MTYKFSKGGREFGDIEYESDSDTKIDFEEDYISLVTNGNAMLVVSGSNVGINNVNPQSDLHLNGTLLLSSSANQELLRLAKANVDTREIVFENEGVDVASIFVNPAENLRIKSEKNNGNMILQVKNNGVVSNIFTLDGSTLRVGINTPTPTAPLDVAGDAIRIRNSNAPSTSTDAGEAGEIRWDSNYIYICIATNNWKRISLESW